MRTNTKQKSPFRNMGASILFPVLLDKFSIENIDPIDYRPLVEAYDPSAHLYTIIHLGIQGERCGTKWRR